MTAKLLFLKTKKLNSSSDETPVKHNQQSRRKKFNSIVEIKNKKKRKPQTRNREDSYKTAYRYKESERNRKV